MSRTSRSHRPISLLTPNATTSRAQDAARGRRQRRRGVLPQPLGRTEVVRLVLHQVVCGRAPARPRARTRARRAHLARVQRLLDAGEEAKAAEAFFDFSCVDIAMGSGHFLVAAVDRIEARLSGFLALNPIPQVTAELDRLRAAAYDALGAARRGRRDRVRQPSSTPGRAPLHLRRRPQPDRRRARASRDLDPHLRAGAAAQLPRPLPRLAATASTGIGTLDEAIHALDPEQLPGQPSLFRDEILAVLGRAESALRRLARTADASAAEIADAREAQAEALAAVQPARDLFDLIVAARIGKASPRRAFDEASLAANDDLPRAHGKLRETLGACTSRSRSPRCSCANGRGSTASSGTHPGKRSRSTRTPSGRSAPGLSWTSSRGVTGRRSRRLRASAAGSAFASSSAGGRGHRTASRRTCSRRALPGSMGDGDPDLYKASAGVSGS